MTTLELRKKNHVIILTDCNLGNYETKQQCIYRHSTNDAAIFINPDKNKIKV